jgi:dipeptidase D
MAILDKLEPKNVWYFFEEITKVPRESKKEDKIIAFLLKFAEDYKLKAKRDTIGNVLITKPASSGMENRKSVVLQSHMDMVCEKNSDVDFDFDNDAIIPVIDGDWVKAKGTTLGADDGIGMAAQLAILADDTIEHGPLECLFTVDEETGLTGAFEIERNFFNSKILLNLDSEDEGEIFIGCAGGIGTSAFFDYEEEDIPENSIAFKLKITGLKGGHSGDDINKPYGNSIKIANRFLFHITNEFEAGLSAFTGGNKHNAIPREAELVFIIEDKYLDDLKEFFNQYKNDIFKEIALVETNLSIELSEVEMPDFIIDYDTQVLFTYALYAYPHGVHKWSNEVDNLVETSTNLAAVKFDDDNTIVVTSSHRSSLKSGLKDITNMVEAVFELAEAEIETSGEYPGWAPNRNSEILSIAEKSYSDLFNKKPVIRAIHAGLECGLFLEKYPDLDMISFGPTLRAVHSPDEKIEIVTVKLWWQHLLDVLKRIPNQE